MCAHLHIYTTSLSDTAPLSAASPITLTDQASQALRKLQAEQPNGERLLLRMGVKNGGCNGMSYVMDFEKEDNITSEGARLCAMLAIPIAPSTNPVPLDNVMEVEGLRLVCNSKSLLYLFGLELDYSDALIGGGFTFRNPNSKGECGCGKSFSV